MTFVKGQSGNPAGRRPGSRNKVTEFVEGLAGENAEELTRKLIEQARYGNPAALRACFDRIWPKPRAPKVAFALPPIRCQADIPAAFDALIQGLADGAFTTDEFHTMTRAVERMAKTIEIADPEVRLAAAHARIALLEAKLEALAKALGGRFEVEQAPASAPDLAPATDLQEAGVAAAADLQDPDVASATDLQNRSPDGAQRDPGSLAPDCGAARLHPGYDAPPLASAANLQARTPPSAANGAAPPDTDDTWMRHFLGPEFDVPWPGYADTPANRSHAA